MVTLPEVSIRSHAFSSISDGPSFTALMIVPSWAFEEK
jgi:hypothetical protein